MSLAARVDVMERIRAKTVIAPNGCYIWTGATTHGYGYITVWVEGRWVRRRVHRVAWSAINDKPLTPREPLDHECHTLDVSCAGGTSCKHRACWNPTHLVRTTIGDNTRVAVRGNALKTHCPKDHEYTPENTRIKPNGARACRECERTQQRAAYARKKV